MTVSNYQAKDIARKHHILMIQSVMGHPNTGLTSHNKITFYLYLPTEHPHIILILSGSSLTFVILFDYIHIVFIDLFRCLDFCFYWQWNFSVIKSPIFFVLNVFLEIVGMFVSCMQCLWFFKEFFLSENGSFILF